MLEADLAIDCDSDRYQGFRIVNLALILITQAIPIMYLGLLYRVRRLLHPPSERSIQAQLRDRQRREQGDDLKPLQFLFTHYDLGWWYFEVIESYRRVTFISILPLIGSKAISAALGMLLATMSASFYRDMKP